MSSVSFLETLSFTVLCVVFIPFLLFFLGIVLFAYVGKSLGIQKVYVDFLVKVFEVSTYLPLDSRGVIKILGTRLFMLKS